MRTGCRRARTKAGKKELGYGNYSGEIWWWFGEGRSWRESGIATNSIFFFFFLVTNSRYILKVKPTEFADRLNIGRKMTVKDDSKVFGLGY